MYPFRNVLPLSPTVLGASRLPSMGTLEYGMRVPPESQWASKRRKQGSERGSDACCYKMVWKSSEDDSPGSFVSGRT